MAVDFNADDTISDLEQELLQGHPAGSAGRATCSGRFFAGRYGPFSEELEGWGWLRSISLRLPAGRVVRRLKPSPRARTRCAGPSSAGGSSWSTTFFMVRRWPMGIPGKPRPGGLIGQ